jgi:hypothetical protein
LGFGRFLASQLLFQAAQRAPGRRGDVVAEQAGDEKRISGWLVVVPGYPRAFGECQPLLSVAAENDNGIKK